MLRPLLLSLGLLLAPWLPRPADGGASAAIRTPAAAPSDSMAYAGDRRWYVAGEAIAFGGRRWVKFGLTRSLTITGAVKVGSFDGVGVYRHLDDGTKTDVLYLPVRAGCEFQPYHLEREVGGVRG
ncbi:MAG: hypothetical protein JWM27_1634 [Gemmatimonadetes bacterium]|nr:hypothetical protein [Gemmatimonadota bacterium]